MQFTNYKIKYIFAQLRKKPHSQTWYLGGGMHNKKQRNYCLIALSSAKLNFNFELLVEMFPVGISSLLHALYNFSYQWKFEFSFLFVLLLYVSFQRHTFSYEIIQSSCKRLHNILRYHNKSSHSFIFHSRCFK